MNNDFKKFLVPVFGLFLVLFNYPVTAIFDRNLTIGGVPLIFLYLFITWIAMIISLAYIMERKKDKP